MNVGIALPIRQQTPEWYAARREGITATDMPVILGVNAYGKVEADLVLEKQTGEVPVDDPETARRKRLGHILEDAIRAEDQAEHGIRLRRVNRLIRHPEIPWALTSLDFERVGERTIVEAKASRSGRFDELPEDAEAQVRWEMGVAGYPNAHVAVLRHGTELACFDVSHSEAAFAGLVTIAEDFRHRLAEGGPFAHSAASVRRWWPQDDGTYLEGTRDWRELAQSLANVRAAAKAAAATKESVEQAIRLMLAAASGVKGDGWDMSLRRNRDSQRINWPAVASGWRELITEHSDDEIGAVLSIHTETVPGARVLRTSFKGEADD